MLFGKGNFWVAINKKEPVRSLVSTFCQFKVKVTHILSIER